MQDETANSICTRQKMVWADVSGGINLSSLQHAAMEEKKIAKENNCNHYLIDITNAIIKHSVIDTIDFVDGLDKMGFSRSDIVAFVISRGKEDFRFSETVKLNRGWTRIGFFSNTSEAEEWLTTTRKG